MTLLLLGGTTEAKQIAKELAEHVYPFVYSERGLLRNTIETEKNTDSEKNYPIISGGFSQFSNTKNNNNINTDNNTNSGNNSVDGLINYIRDNNISFIIDATHPYANNISHHASDASKTAGIRYIRYQRPSWEATTEDNWIQVKDDTEIVDKVSAYSRPFFTIGQSVETLITLKKDQTPWLIRSATKLLANDPSLKERQDLTFIQAIGHFNIDEERALLTKYKIDVIISKLSGSHKTVAKIIAARELNIPVIMLERPTPAPADKIYDNINHCLADFLQRETGSSLQQAINKLVTRATDKPARKTQ